MKTNISLGNRMKSYEIDFVIPSYLPFIVRLDGKKFKKFCKKFKKPFDPIFTISMIKTMNHLLIKTTAITGYTHSDEISLIFPAMCTKSEYEDKSNKSSHVFNGRAYKICTTLSSLCSTSFIYFIQQKFNLANDEPPNCIFDARIVHFPENNTSDILNHMIWRSRYDCHRNAISAYGRYYLKKDQNFRKNKLQTIELLRKHKKINWDEDVLPHIKWGVFAKKQLFRITSEKGDNCIRSKVVNKSLKIKYSDKMLKILLKEKTWPQNLSSIIEFFNLTSNLEYLNDYL